MNDRMSTLESESGMATVEALPLLIVFVVLFAYSFGSFGVIHSGILNSIAARNYAFETFRHRTNLTYLRSNRITHMYYNGLGNRIHTTLSESGAEGNSFPATERRIAMGMDSTLVGRDQESIHNVAIYGIRDGVQNTTIESNPVWIMSQYGICLTAACGGE